MEPLTLFAFYGSLRRGMPNYMMYSGRLKYLRTVNIAGYRLYSLGVYPYAVKSPEQDAVLVADIFRVDDSATRQAIHHLETEAGYFLDVISLDNYKVGIYLFEKEGNDVWVRSGNWEEFYCKLHYKAD